MKANAPKRKVFQDAVDLISPEAVNAVDGGQTMISVEKIVPFHNHPFRLYEGKRLDDMVESIREHEEDVRQIEAVTRILGNEFGMEVAKFTSEENMETRATIKEQFQKGDRLQAIVAIKCLDEGVNIPGIRTAFILASTTNPKEYIQRRGRVLRKAENKAL